VHRDHGVRGRGCVSARRSAESWLLLASYGSVAVALILIVVKAAAWLYTGSASLLGSLIDSFMDSMASLLSMAAVRYSLKPADEEHRFGHGKAESLAALAQSAFIMGSAVLLFLYCVERIVQAEEHVLENTGIGIAVSVCAIVCTLGLLALQTHAIGLTGSTAISADRLHYKSDLLMNGAVIVSLLFAQRGVYLVDVIMGLFIAVVISRGAVHIGWEAFGLLMDKALPPEVDHHIRELALSSPGVLGVHDLRTRRSGMRYIIQLHVELEDETSLLVAHGIADAVETRLREAYPGADVIIHQDPHSAVAEEYAEALAQGAIPAYPGLRPS
jgi:ferrous-iron efflux pump FieF